MTFYCIILNSNFLFESIMTLLIHWLVGNFFDVWIWFCFQCNHVSNFLPIRVHRSLSMYVIWIDVLCVYFYHMISMCSSLTCRIWHIFILYFPTIPVSDNGHATFSISKRSLMHVIHQVCPSTHRAKRLMPNIAKKQEGKVSIAKFPILAC